MFTNILIPTDGSKLAEAAAENAIAFARDAKASVVLVSVIEPFHIFTTDSEKLAIAKDDYDRFADVQAVKFLSAVEARARLQGVVSHTVKVQSDQVHTAIVATAIENGCDLIAMGSHGRGSVASVLIGSVTAKVLSHSRIPVLVYR